MLTLNAFNFDIAFMMEQAVSSHALGEQVKSSGNLFKDPGAAFSLGLALALGLAGFPHLMMRFYTVESLADARLSAVIAIAINAGFMIIVCIIGYGAISLLADPAVFQETGGKMTGGPNMVAVHLSRVVGGPVFLGFIAAVAFATILAVVAGLTLAIASAVSHDLYATAFRKGKATEKSELFVSRLSVFVVGILTIGLGFLFEGQNVAVLAAIATSIAASVNFPVLLLAIYWKKLTTLGAISGGASGLIFSIVAIVLGPDVWVNVFGNETPVFPYSYPTLIAMPAAFIVAMTVSQIDTTNLGKSEKAAVS